MESPSYFVTQEENNSQDAERILIPSEIMDRMIATARFKMKLFTLKLRNQYSNSEILISLTPDELIHISNFPRSLLHNDSNNSGTRHTIAANSSRWAGRSNNQRYRNWTPPSPPWGAGSGSDFITLYSKPDYLLGNTSIAAFEASADRLNSRGIMEMGEYYDRKLEEEEDPGVPAIVQTEPAEVLSEETVRYELA